MKDSGKTSELFVITKAKELCNYIFEITEKSPKKYRFTLISRMQNLALNTLEYLYRANDVYVGSGGRAINERSEWQQKVITELRLLDYMAMLSADCNCILMRQYEQIAKRCTEVLALTVQWKKRNLIQTKNV